MNRLIKLNGFIKQGNRVYYIIKILHDGGVDDGGGGQTGNIGQSYQRAKNLYQLKNYRIAQYIPLQ